MQAPYGRDGWRRWAETAATAETAGGDGRRLTAGGDGKRLTAGGDGWVRQRTVMAAECADPVVLPVVLPVGRVRQSRAE